MQQIRPPTSMFRGQIVDTLPQMEEFETVVFLYQSSPCTNIYTGANTVRESKHSENMYYFA